MEPNFKDYLHESCDNTFYSKLSLISPNDVKGVYDYKFTYHLVFDESYISLQAKEFANELLINPHLTDIVNKNISGSPDKRRLSIENVYIYSYMKMFNYCVMMMESEGTFAGNPMANSIGFGGHVEVYRSFYDTFQLGISSRSNVNTSLFKTLIIKDEDVEAFKRSSFFKDYNQSSRKFFFQNSDFERLLQAFEEKAEHSLWIKKFNSNLNLDPKHHPLGNTCFFTTEDCVGKEILCVNNRAMSTDTISKFWNIANCIFLENCDSKFNRSQNYPYISVSSLDLNDECVYAQVQSITGLNCGDKFTAYGSNPDYSNNKGSNNPNGPSKPPTDPNKGRGGDSRKGSRNPNNNNSGPKQPNKDNISSFLKKDSANIKALKSAIVSGGRRSLEALKNISSDPVVRDTILTFMRQKHEEKMRIMDQDDNEKITLRIENNHPTKQITTRYGNSYLPFEREVKKSEYEFASQD